MDDDEDFVDDDFLAAVDQLVAQHQGKGQQLTQPDSPGARPSAAAARAAPSGVQQQHAQRPAAQPPAQQHHTLHHQAQQRLPAHQPAFPIVQHQPAPQHPPHLNGAFGPVSGLTRPSSAALQPEGQGLLGSGPSGQTGFPIGRVTQLAADLRAHEGPAGSTAPADLQALLSQLQQERGRLQEQLGSAEGTNKLLRSNLDQAERDRQSLRQRLQQLEARSQPSASTQASFTALEMQRQLETLKQQLLFKEQEMEELKRQQSDKLERLREAEAAVQSLQAQVLARQQQQQQQQQDGGGGSPASAAGPRSFASLRRPLAEQQQQQQPQRASGQKRRQSAAGEASAGAPQASLPATGPAANQAAAGSTANGRAAPRLGPAVVTAAGLSAVATGAGLVTRLWAVCGDSLGALLGAAAFNSFETRAAASPPTGSSLAATGRALGGSESAPTALLLRTQAKGRAAAAPDPLAGSFKQAFGQQLQQVAAGLLPAPCLLDSIAAMAASVIGLACQNGGKQGLSPVPPTTPGGKHGAHSRPQLAQPQVQLLSDGLQVLQQLLEHDASCLSAAVASASGTLTSQRPHQQPGAVADSPSIASTAVVNATAELGRRLQLSQRVSLSVAAGKEQGKLQRLPPAALVVEPAPHAVPGQALPQLDRALRQHSSIFAAWGEGLVGVLVGASLLAGQQHLCLLQAALGAVRALTAGVPAGGGREAFQPVLGSGALESFLRPPALRQPALQLLHLLLESPALTQAFEQSLASAGSSGAGDGETPGAGAATDAPAGLPSDPSGAASGQPSRDPTEGNSKGEQQQEAAPMQVDVEDARTQAAGTSTPWLGAPYVLRRALQTLSLALPGKPPPVQCQQQQAVPAHEQQPESVAAAWAAGACATAAAPMPAAAEVPGTAAETWALYGAQRQALRLVAMLRERHSYGVLSHLIHGHDEGGTSSGGAGLCHRLVQLLRSASAQREPGCAPSPLLPTQFPTGPLERCAADSSSTAGAAPGGGAAATCAAQLEWQQRLRLAQEALTLLRGLLLDETVGGHVLEELVSPPASCRLWLATLSRLSRLEPPPQHPHAVAAASLPLAPWAQAIGSSSSVAGGCINPGAGSGPLCCCSVEDVAYMARSMRHRVLHRLGEQQQ